MLVKFPAIECDKAKFSSSQEQIWLDVPVGLPKLISLEAARYNTQK